MDERPLKRPQTRTSMGAGAMCSLTERRLRSARAARRCVLLAVLIAAPASAASVVSLHVTEDGAAEIGVGLATFSVSSLFSGVDAAAPWHGMRGWHGLGPAAGGARWANLSVSRIDDGAVWEVRARAARWALTRRYVLDQPGSRVLVNDTIERLGDADELVGVWIVHAARPVAGAGAHVEQVVVAGMDDGYMCGTNENAFLHSPGRTRIGSGGRL